MQPAFVVLLALASIAPAAESPGSQAQDGSRAPAESPIPDSKTACQPAQSTRDCAVMTNNLGGTYFSAGKYREAELLFTRAISLWATESAASDDLAKAFHNL